MGNLLTSRENLWSDVWMDFNKKRLIELTAEINSNISSNSVQDKDFYDIYVLSQKYEFSYEELRNAVVETFENRKTQMTMDSAAFGDEFLNDPMHQTRWNSFLKMESGNNVICDARRVFNQIHIL